MTNDEIDRKLAMLVNRIEADLAEMNDVATDAYRASIEPDKLAKVASAHAATIKAANRLHRAMFGAVKKRPGEITPQFGK